MAAPSEERASSDLPGLQRYGSLLRNVAWLSVASFAVKPFWFIFIIVICARLLSAEGYGVLNTALSMSALTFSITGLGMGPYLVREVAVDRSRAPYLLSRFLALRLGLAVAAVGAAVAAGSVLGYQPVLLAAVVLACLYQTGFSLIEFSHNFFQAFERLRYQALSVVAEKAVVIAAGLTALILTGSPGWTLFGMALGMLATAAGTLGVTHRRVTPVSIALPRRDFLRGSLRPLLPFAVVGILGMFFFRIDTIMVEAMLGLRAAGQYGLAFRIVEALNMLPFIIVHAALYPRLSRIWSEGNSGEVRRLVRWASAGLLAASVPIVVVIYFTAPWLITTIVTDADLLPAIDALQLLAWVFPLTCLRVVLYGSLLAMGALRPLIIVISVGLIANVGLNLIAIPSFGIMGAAGATIVSELVVYIAYVFIWMRRDAK